MSGKQRGYAFDVDAWIQFHLLRLASFHRETTKADIAVLAEIIQRYHGKFGNGWASHDHLGAMAGVHKASVIRAKRNLERLGFITIVQAGRRGSATVYQPNFALVPKKGSTDATETKGSTHATEIDGLGSIDETETCEYGSMDATPTYLPDRPTKAGSQIDRHDPAPASPPATVGLEATAPGGAGGFEEIFHSYYGGQKGHAGSKAKARAILKALAPSPELHAHILGSATDWYEAWAAQGNPNAARMHLSTWLENEDYDCKPPAAFKPKERKAKDKSKSKPANDNVPVEEDLPSGPMVCDVGPFSPFGTFNGRIVDTSVRRIDRNTEKIVVHLECDNGQSNYPLRIEHTLYSEHPDASIQARGQNFLSEFGELVGESIDDTEQLHGLAVQCTINNKLAISYKEAA